MKKIFISATGVSSGQSLIAWSIAEVLHSRGMRLGFFKPFVTQPIMIDGRVVDRDALLMKEYFHFQDQVMVLSPVVPEQIPPDEVTEEEHLKKIDLSYQEIQENKDALIIMGSKQIFYEAESPYLPDGTLIKRFDCPVILIDKFQSESMSLYSALAVDAFLKDKVKIIIINQVPPERMEAASRKLIPFFEKRGTPIIFLVPQDRMLAAFTVRNIIEIVHGEVLTEKQGLDNLVESTSISSAYLQGSLTLFRRVYNKIILVGFRVDHAGAQPLPPVISGILITGGRKPPPIVVSMCEDLGIPLIVSPYDTFTNMERIQKEQIHLTPEDVFKLKRFLQLLGGEEAIRKIVDAIA